MELILATASDIGYLPRMQKCMESMVENSNFDKNVFVYLKSTDTDIRMTNDMIIMSVVDINSIEALNKNKCIQHGEFLKSGGVFDGIKDEDVIVFIDGDVEIQRPMNEREIELFNGLKDDEVSVGYNASMTDTLRDEFERLQPTDGKDCKFYVDAKENKVYNTGVLAMNKKTWNKMCKEYIRLFPYIDSLFGHYAKQQWLISFILTTQGYTIKEMDYYIHNHTHHGVVEGSRIDSERKVYYKDELVLFKHQWIHQR